MSKQNSTADLSRRESNMDLLRIVSIYLVICFHMSWHSGFSYAAGFSVNKLVIKTFNMFGELGVNLFILLSGYYMVNKNFRWKKAVLLWAEVWFYWAFSQLAAWKLGIYSITTPRDAILTFFPIATDRNWFIVVYILIYALSPYFNILAHALSRADYKRFLLTALVIWCFIPTVLGLLYNDTEKLLYYNRLIWLIIIYFTGAYIRLHGCSLLLTGKRAAALFAGSFGAMMASILVIDEFRDFFAFFGTTNPAYFWQPNNVPMLLASLGFFGVFLHLKVSYRPAFSRIASTTLGIYLFHDGLLNSWMWRTYLNLPAYQNSPNLVFTLPLYAIGVFAFGASLDFLRQALEKRTLARLLDSKAVDGTARKMRICEEAIQKEGLYGAARRFFQKGFWKKTAAVCMAGSFSLLSFFQIVQMNQWIIITTVLTAFSCGFCFYKKTARETGSYAKRHPCASAALLVIAVSILRQEYLQKGVPHYDTLLPPLPFHFFRPAYWVLALPALFFLLLWIWRKGRGFLSRLWMDMDQTDKKIYLAFSAASCVLVLTAYLINPQWYSIYDQVYSIDAGYCVWKLFPLSDYFYIQHPTLGILTFPIWTAVQACLKWIIPAQLLERAAIACVQLINVQFLLAAGFMIKQLSKSRWTLALYLTSLPMFLFTMFFEKCQIITFLMVLYVWLRTYSAEPGGGPLRQAWKDLLTDGGGTRLSMMLSIGAMPVTVFLYLYELLRREASAAKLRNILRTAVWGVLFFICTGRIYLLNLLEFFGDASSKLHTFGLQGHTLMERCFSFLNLVHGSFIGLPSSRSDGFYWWTDVMGHASPLALIILALMVLGSAVNWKDVFVKFCTLWLVGAAALIIMVQWAVPESPLFGVYFFWALVPLFQKGFQALVEQFRWKERAAYCALLIPMFILNLINMLDIASFLKTL